MCTQTDNMCLNTSYRVTLRFRSPIGVVRLGCIHNAFQQ